MSLAAMQINNVFVRPGGGGGWWGRLSDPSVTVVGLCMVVGGLTMMQLLWASAKGKEGSGVVGRGLQRPVKAKVVLINGSSKGASSQATPCSGSAGRRCGISGVAYGL